MLIAAASPRRPASGSRPLAAAASRRSRGFTLIELIFAVAMLGVLLAAGLPSFTAWTRNAQVRSVAEALQNGLRLAQAEAVRRNQSVVMLFTNDANPRLDPTTIADGRNWTLQTIRSEFVREGAVEFIRAGVLTDVASGVTLDGPADAALCFGASGRLVTLASPASTPAVAACASGPVQFDITKASADTASDRPLRVTVQVGGQVRMCDPKRPALSAAAPDGC